MRNSIDPEYQSYSGVTVPSRTPRQQYLQSRPNIPQNTSNSGQFVPLLQTQIPPQSNLQLVINCICRKMRTTFCI
ncbi:uncharacterized protein BO95DRAFT_446869 [Aspergillus brunneoviolaceus CBS 621.78]|uniref:Uncharacterized protein n=1 Tax=Aspergillus brunneoviolaceus CBS 621.78 TaxID=1450534 RepID=A0ACD1FX68_9EURO|nr:hypothetical protein BO95DRAFT_446869 [Aspergillus brunneoviolaceus CBS 621.78]RAH41554.1 hypothetical protein BO95DRAFT_446869 [Aspergillus brunneoviolaceus CBS 621.78]